MAPCLKCGTATDRRVEFGGLIEASAFACPRCLEEDFIEFEELRRQFQELIDAGVPRSAANAIMIGRIDAAPKD